MRPCVNSSGATAFSKYSLSTPCNAFCTETGSSKSPIATSNPFGAGAPSLRASSRMSALRFCSAFTTSAPTLPVPPVTKIFILEISCRLLYELAKDGLRHADYVANLWPSAFDHASSLALLVGTFLYLWAHTRKKRLAKGSARAVYYPGFFGAFWIVFTTFAIRLADFEGP